VTARRAAHPRARLDLLHAERDLIVVNKPAGLLTIPSSPGRKDHEDSILMRAREYARHKQGRRAYAGLLHRLDRGTSGALAVALSRDAHTAGRLRF
jgi:tRNA pseudouridine32 synthase/23S rRNA pseudouridine746 synthase